MLNVSNFGSQKKKEINVIVSTDDGKTNKGETINTEPILNDIESVETVDLPSHTENMETTNVHSQDTVDCPNQRTETNHQSDGASDEDLELLRQYALKTKSAKVKTDAPQKTDIDNKTEAVSEDEDSDTAELRMICLKSALLKKAIEMKQKQKLQKRLSESSNIHEFDICTEDLGNIDNNTDIESVDMEIGSDADDKGKVYITECTQTNAKVEEANNVSKEDEIDEDEDLLRAKLLTSLSKNLPNLVDLNVLNTTLKEVESETVDTKVNNVETDDKKTTNVEAKKFIIQLGESDSEAEHEATKNLTKMHMKLSEQAEFQQKLDQFLKSTRMEVEKTKLPDIVQEQPKPAEKFVAKVRMESISLLKYK